MNGIYLGEFEKPEDVIKEFDLDASALDGARVLIAWYDVGGYEGSAFVLFERDGKLWEVHGSHCSCNGLDDQWEPEETTWPALAARKWKYGSEPAMLTLIQQHQGHP